MEEQHLPKEMAKKDMKKDILFLCQFFYPEYAASAELSYDTAEALSRAGFSVDALCGYPKEYTTENRLPMAETVNGVGIRRLKYIQLARKSKIGRLVNYFSFTAVMFLNLFRLRRYRSLVVYTNPPLLPWVAYAAKKLFGCKLFLVVHDVYPEIAVSTKKIGAGGAIAKLMRHINRRVYNSADRVVALSSGMKHFIEQNRPISKDKVCVIPNWYQDIPQVPKQTYDADFLKACRGKFVVSYLGNMGICQDMDTLLQAAKLLRHDENIHFLFAGHGNKTETVQAFIEREGLTNITLLGFLQNEDYQAALSVSRVAVVSLVEGICELCAPSKVYAYMMAGLPVFAVMDATADLAVEVLESRCGIHAANGDAAKLAENIRILSQNEPLCSQMGENARQVFLRKYNKEICMQQYIDMFSNEMEYENVRCVRFDSVFEAGKAKG